MGPLTGTYFKTNLSRFGLAGSPLVAILILKLFKILGVCSNNTYVWSFYCLLASVGYLYDKFVGGFNYLYMCLGFVLSYMCKSVSAIFI